MQTIQRPADERFQLVQSLPFLLFHLVPLLAIFTGVTWADVALLACTYFARVFFITGGYHRYFSHRTYKMGRVMQFLMGFGGITAAQKGPLWWAAHHRHHHRYSDTEMDVHSPRRGFWWSHVGWILCEKTSATNSDAVKDLAKYPEIRFLNNHDWIGPWSLGVLCFLIGGWSGLLIGFFLSTILVWHATFTINSLAHVIGRRRYETGDDSKNSLPLALITMGEGWHNNHHRYQASTRQGFVWYQLDMTYQVLRLLQALHLVHGLRTPPKRVLVEGGYRVRRGADDASAGTAGLAADGAVAEASLADADASTDGTHAATYAVARPEAASGSPDSPDSLDEMAGV